MAQLPDWSLAARQRLQMAGAPAAGPSVNERHQLLDAGERLLSLGDAQAARQAFERAAMMLHAPDTEAALVRTHMQAGEYRQALAFGAHAAGAHRREWPAGTALYAWLLQIGGQGVVAQHMLNDALALAPDDAALLAARAQLARPWPQPSGPLLAPPLQVAPYAVGAAVPTGARVVGSALLMASGTAALAPVDLLRAGTLQRDRVWLRNGLGDTVVANVVQCDEALGLVLLRLAAPLPAVALTPVAHDPFAGAPASMVEFGTGDSAATWPLLRQGFFCARHDRRWAPIAGYGCTFRPAWRPGVRRGGAVDRHRHRRSEWAGQAGPGQRTARAFRPGVGRRHDRPKWWCCIQPRPRRGGRGLRAVTALGAAGAAGWTGGSGRICRFEASRPGAF